jgi:hypothetical protein
MNRGAGGVLAAGQSHRPRPPLGLQCRARQPWEDTLLGVVPDAEVARRTGRGEDAVRFRRAQLRIPAPRPGSG